MELNHVRFTSKTVGNWSCASVTDQGEILGIYLESIILLTCSLAQWLIQIFAKCNLSSSISLIHEM